MRLFMGGSLSIIVCVSAIAGNQFLLLRTCMSRFLDEWTNSNTFEFFSLYDLLKGWNDTPQPPTEFATRPVKYPRNQTFPLQLQLPFYIYEGDLDWSNALSSSNVYLPYSNETNVTFSPEHNKYFVPLLETNYTEYKHSDDYWFLQAAKQHPMRVLDPQEAKLFVVPTLLSALESHTFSIIGRNWTLCVEDRCNFDLLRHADNLLHESPWFQRYGGRDHIVVDSHFHKQVYTVLMDDYDIRNLEDDSINFYESTDEKDDNYDSNDAGIPHDPEQQQQGDQWQQPLLRRRKSSLFSCNLIAFENVHPPMDLTTAVETDGDERVMLPSLYVGKSCDPSTPKTADFAMIGTLKDNDPMFVNRTNICNWLLNSTSFDYSVSDCGTGEQCPALAQARFGFHPRGDTFGSNRLMDTLLSGSVPIFTHRQQYDILPQGIAPWHEMGVWIPITSRPKFDKYVQKLLTLSNDPATGGAYEETRKHIAKYWHILDPTQGIGQFDAYMHQFAILLNMTTTTTIAAAADTATSENDQFATPMNMTTTTSAAIDTTAASAT